MNFKVSQLKTLSAGEVAVDDLIYVIDSTPTDGSVKSKKVTVGDLIDSRIYGISSSQFVLITGNWVNPAWISSLDWAKITNAPSFVTSISALTDVQLATPLSGQALVYNGTKWVNQGIGELDTLASVTTRGNTTTNAITVGGVTVSASNIASLSLYDTLQPYLWSIRNNGTNLHFVTDGGTNALTIAANGNVRINTGTDAGFKLDVNGTARVNNTFTITKSGSNNYFNFEPSAPGIAPYIQAFYQGGIDARLYFSNNNLQLRSAGSTILYGLDCGNITANASVVLGGTGDQRVHLFGSTNNFVQFSDAGATHIGVIGTADATTYIQVRTGAATTMSNGTLSTVFFNSGNVGVNTTTDNGARLTVKGSGATSATTSLLMQNSVGTTTFSVDDSGSGRFNNIVTILNGGLNASSGNITTTGNITATGTSSQIGNLQILSTGNASSSGFGISFPESTMVFQSDTLGSTTVGSQFTFRKWNNTTAPLNTISSGILRITNTGFNSGNANNLSGNTLWIEPIYNFSNALITGTTVRGIYYNPTLTAMVGTTHRAIETTSGDVIFGAGGPKLILQENIVVLNAASTLSICFGQSTTSGYSTGIFSEATGAYNRGNLILAASPNGSNTYNVQTSDRNIILTGTSTNLYKPTYINNKTLNFVNDTANTDTLSMYWTHAQTKVALFSNSLGPYGIGDFRIALLNTYDSTTVSTAHTRFMITGDTYNILIGTTTDAGYKLDVNGTARVNSSLYVTDPSFTGSGRLYQSGNVTFVVTGGPGGGGENITFGPSNRIFINAQQTRFPNGSVQMASTLSLGSSNATSTNLLLMQGSITAGSALGRGIGMDTTLVAAANNDVLVGLDINPTFTNGAFTGVTNIAARFGGNVVFTEGLKTISIAAPTATGNGGELTISAGNATTAGSGGNISLQPGNGAGGPGAGTVIISNTSWWNGATVNGTLTVTNSGPNTGTSLQVNAGGQNGLTIYWDNLTPFMQYGLVSARQARFVNSSSYSFSNNILVGTTTDNGARLTVKGSGATSATTSILVQNSSNTTILSLNDAGTLSVGAGSQGIIVAGTLSLQYPNTITYNSSYNMIIGGTTAGSGNISIDGSSIRFLAALNGITYTQPIAKSFLIKKEQGGADTTSFLNISGADQTNAAYAGAGGVVRIYGGLNNGIAAQGLLILAHNGTTTQGAVVVGGTSANAAALLDIQSTTQGFLPPRMTTAQINAITSPANGLEVYNTTLACPCFYDGIGWRKVSHSTM